MNPILDYLKEKYSIIVPECFGLSLPLISEDSIEKFSSFCSEKDDLHLVALEAAATVSKSSCIAVALLDGFITIPQAIECSRFEENLQIEEFGRIEGSHDVEEHYELMVLTAAKNLISLKQTNAL